MMLRDQNEVCLLCGKTLTLKSLILNMVMVGLVYIVNTFIVIFIALLLAFMLLITIRTDNNFGMISFFLNTLLKFPG
jgi:type IV secretory pathway VirB3-like protein